MNFRYTRLLFLISFHTNVSDVIALEKQYQAAPKYVQSNAVPGKSVHRRSPAFREEAVKTVRELPANVILVLIWLFFWIRGVQLQCGSRITAAVKDLAALV